METKTDITITVTVDDPTLVESLKTFLRDMAQLETEPLDRNERRLLTIAREHAADAEKEADKLRTALVNLVQ